jgi:hypothetical protein
MSHFVFSTLLSLLIFPCSRRDHTEQNEGRFVTLTSSEKTVWVLEYFCLYTITPFAIEDPNIGFKERLDILKGKTVLDNSIFENLNCNPFRIPDSLGKYREFLDSVKNNDSIRINSLSFPEKGIYINELIKRGYIITFADDEGEYYVEKDHK